MFPGKGRWTKYNFPTKVKSGVKTETRRVWQEAFSSYVWQCMVDGVLIPAQWGCARATMFGYIEVVAMGRCRVVDMRAHDWKAEGLEGFACTPDWFCQKFGVADPCQLIWRVQFEFIPLRV